MAARGNGRRGTKGKAQSAAMEEFYSATYGPRWTTLKAAMCADPAKIALYNRFCQLPFAEVIPVDTLERVDPDSAVQAFRHVSATAAGIDKPPIDEFNVRGYYLMDYASAMVIDQLRVGPFHKVLDMCAAPGGKSIAIAQFLSPDAELVANEHDATRCARLRRNLFDHVPVNYVPWRVTQRNAETWHDPCVYDRVLVDAPCSSERHLLVQSHGAPVSTRLWTEATSRQLADVQRSLLQRAIETCKEDGRIVYSTCSLSPHENDGVVRAALQRTRCEVEVVKPGVAGVDGDGRVPRLGEPTKLGWIVLPDVAEGWGPIYFSVLHKRRHERKPESTSEDETSDSEPQDAAE